MTSILHASAIAALALGTGAAAVTTLRPDPPIFEVPQAPWSAGDALDGQSFATTDQLVGRDTVLEDVLHFVDGRFQSEMCQQYCDFGWTPYETWTDDGTIHFTATTRCPDAPHTIVWVGSVTDGTMSFSAQWRTERWYWTRHIDVVGQGNPVPEAG